MDRAVEILGYVNNALFVVLAAYCLAHWRRHGTVAAGWSAATFTILAVVVLVGYFTPDNPETPGQIWVQKLIVVSLLVFPYALYRFMRAFSASGRLLDRAVLVTGGVLALWTLLLPDIPSRGEPRPEWFQIYLAAFLAYWTALLVIVAANLWRAGRGQPTLPRRRMRLLSLGAVGLTVVLLIAGAAANADASVRLGSSLLTFLSALLFFFGFAPPSWLRATWRMPEQEALYSAAERLVSASTEEEVANAILPHVAQIIGARSAALIAEDGHVIGSVGEPRSEEGWATYLADVEERADTDVITLDFHLARLVVWASRYTPFFGQEEVGLLRQLGVMANLALERSALFASERDARAQLVSANEELEQTNAALAEREARLADAQAITHVGSFEWFPATDVVHWSDEMFRIFGVDPETFEPTGSSATQLLHPDDIPKVNIVVEDAFAKDRPYEFDSRLVRPDGVERIIHARGHPERSEEGDIVRVTGTVQDVTDLRRAEREIARALQRETESRVAIEAANREMESFLYTVSHDLNGPLISVMGFLEFLEKDYGDSLPERGRFYLERMEASTKYMQALIKDLLDLSRVGRVQTEPDDVALDPLVLDVAGDVKTRYAGFNMTASALPMVRMNAVRARQLLSNLMLNAAKYSKRDDPHVSITAEERSDGFYEISVRDNGPGIEPKFRERVFGVFQRLEGGDTEGTGIGLAICKRIVENAGGEIWIADSETGTDIRFTVPPASVAVGREAAGA